MKKTGFEHKSYDAHANWYDEDMDLKVIFDNKPSIDFWRHDRQYSLTNPLHSTINNKWLTVGDGKGMDAHWLESKGLDVEASDIAPNILKKSFEQGYIKKYSRQNAEKINYEDNTFDFVLCKEAYHHFPRPYIALYEMIRVATIGVILIEPLDIGIQMPAIIFVKNILDRINPNLINKVWKNRYSFETVGNYVYKVSEREMEKVAMGINLPYVAFKGLNDYYSVDLDFYQPTTNTAIFSKVKRKIWIRNIFCKLGIIPYQLLSSIILKKEPTPELREKLLKDGYKIVKLAKNPYV